MVRSRGSRSKWDLGSMQILMSLYALPWLAYCTPNCDVVRVWTVNCLKNFKFSRWLTFSGVSKASLYRYFLHDWWNNMIKTSRATAEDSSFTKQYDKLKKVWQWICIHRTTGEIKTCTKTEREIDAIVWESRYSYSGGISHPALSMIHIWDFVGFIFAWLAQIKWVIKYIQKKRIFTRG